LLFNVLQAMKKIMLLFAMCISFAAIAQQKVMDHCALIKVEKGESAAQTYYVTPMIDGISIKKIKSGKSQTYLCTVTAVSQIKREGTLAVIVFDNDDTIGKPARILKGVQEDKNYEYFAMFLLDEKEMNMFKESTLKGVILMEQVVIPKQKEDVQKLMTCLINK